MAATYYKSGLVYNLVLVLSLLLVASMAEGRLFNLGFRKKPSTTLVCDSVFGIRQGDTCFGVEQIFNITAETFGTLNPNLNCDKLFVGQWLCVEGSS
ncbi:hypothetical protein H6P81_014423 [Aristolochia fimbriata]|uniref:LysM domain-containing protein n=1 Tax=Aristolochia fimbriata TaxID=158543 RepID=A0AAV7EHH1_ARIFI|nr:hypothetical protein H6P81_014423 [Aristolochia fimbriata]